MTLSTLIENSRMLLLEGLRLLTLCCQGVKLFLCSYLSFNPSLIYVYSLFPISPRALHCDPHTHYHSQLIRLSLSMSSRHQRGQEWKDPEDEKSWNGNRSPIPARRHRHLILAYDFALAFIFKRPQDPGACLCRYAGYRDTGILPIVSAGHRQHPPNQSQETVLVLGFHLLLHLHLVMR